MREEAGGEEEEEEEENAFLFYFSTINYAYVVDVVVVEPSLLYVCVSL